VPSKVLQALSRMDMELHAFTFKVDENILSNFTERLHATVASLLQGFLQQMQTIMNGEVAAPSTSLRFPVVAKEALTACLSLKYFEHCLDAETKLMLDFFSACDDGPMLLWHPHASCVDIAVFEEFSTILAMARALTESDSAGKYITQRLASSLDGLTQVLKHGNDILVKQEDKCVKPKVDVFKLIFDKEAEYWAAVEANAQSNGIFATSEKVDEICTNREQVKADIGSASLAIKEAITVLLALGKSDIAARLRLVWLLTNIR
jgi:hypothetical protein